MTQNKNYYQAEINKKFRQVMNAQQAYRDTVREMLKQTGQTLRLENDHTDELVKRGWPRGLRMMTLNEDFDMLDDVVFDSIALDADERISIHCAFDGSDLCDCTMQASHLSFDEFTNVAQNIQWPE